MITMHPLVPGFVYANRWPSLDYASDSIWERHLGDEQLCKIVYFSKSDSDLKYSTERSI